MNITFYNSNAEKNLVDKTDRIIRLVELSGTLRDACSVTNPSVTIELDPAKILDDPVLSNYIVDEAKGFVTDENNTKIIFTLIKKILDSNYAYIDLFDRYYFIEDIVSVRNNLWLVKMHVDVLMSFKENIYRQSALISRNENEFNVGIIDKEAVTLAHPKITTYELANDFFDDLPFSSGHSKLQYVLTLVQDERSS